ncbi:MAG TPA: hypothetical protein VFW28_00590 [Micropepsaceae bacterium]|nr:hypothetical protein [Micropepsaceae bacterium]
MKVKGILLATAASMLAMSPAFGQASTAATSGDLENKIKTLQDQLESLRSVQDQLHSLQQQLDALKASEATARDGAAKETAARDSAIAEAAAKGAAAREAVARATAEVEAKKKSTDTAATFLTAYVQNVQLVAPAAAPQQEQEDIARRIANLESAAGRVQIGATFFGDFAYYSHTGFGPQFLTQLNQDGPGNNGFNSFDITRTYINFLFTPLEEVTLRLTPNIYRQVDVSNATSNGKNSAIASSSNGNLGFRLKYAYLDFNTLFNWSDTLKGGKVTAGQTVNPLVDWEEGLYGYRYVNLVPWNYLSLSSTYTGVTVHGPVSFNGIEYLDYNFGVFNTASFHAIETNDKKQLMGRITWYPLGTTADRTGFGLTAFDDAGYSTASPDSPSTHINRAAFLAHYQTPSRGLLVGVEYDLGWNAFSVGNLFAGAGPADAISGATVTQPDTYANFTAVTKAILPSRGSHQEGYAAFGHLALGDTPFALFGMFHYFKPNTNFAGTDPLDFYRIVAGVSYSVNSHFQLALDDQNLTYFQHQFTMTPAEISAFSPSLATANPSGIPNIVPTSTNAIFINLLFNY